MTTAIRPTPIITLPTWPETRVRHKRDRMVLSMQEQRMVHVPAEATTTRSGKPARNDRQGDWT